MTSAEVCRERGWTIGTVVRRQLSIPPFEEPHRITAIGESDILVMTMSEYHLNYEIIPEDFECWRGPDYD